MNCDLADSCCHLDAVAGDATIFATFRTAAAPDPAAPAAPSFVVSCVGYTSATAEWAVTQAYDPAAPDGVTGSDVFIVRYFGRRATEPEAAFREVALTTFQLADTGRSLPRSHGDSPLGFIEGSAHIAALAGGWVFCAEAVDAVGNVGRGRSWSVPFCTRTGGIPRPRAERELY